MTFRPTTRAVVCVLLVLFLCAPVVAIAAPAADRERAIEFRTLGAPCSMVVMNRGGAGYDHARPRPCAPTLLTLVPLDSAASDPGHFTAAIERRLPRSLWIAGPRTGRSPPIS